MRVWDIPPEELCNKHLIAQHHEIHCIISIIVNGKKGFANHPEVNRWRGRGAAIQNVHFHTVTEMLMRGFNHHSPVYVSDFPEGQDSAMKPEPWQSIEEQYMVLKEKHKEE